jgi:hypothetical protein
MRAPCLVDAREHGQDLRRVVDLGSADKPVGFL